MEYWKHPSQGRVQSFDGEFEKHPEKKEELESQGWFRIKGRDDWSAFKAKKSYKKKKKK
jgi:hypothetical protein|tara:strand:- start:362 stop:538 length:177 start_codon:yes stop_codon:yes gene_type:complete